MPPPATTKTLSQKQKDVLKQWIAAGAPYQLHWSFIPPAASRATQGQESIVGA